MINYLAGRNCGFGSLLQEERDNKGNNVVLDHFSDVVEGDCKESTVISFPLVICVPKLSLFPLLQQCIPSIITGHAGYLLGRTRQTERQTYTGSLRVLTSRYSVRTHNNQRVSHNSIVNSNHLWTILLVISFCYFTHLHFNLRITYNRGLFCVDTVASQRQY
jgi:hypothetical protein